MDIPCAILIAAFCLPDSSFKLEVNAKPEGSLAVVTAGEVRARILLSEEEDGPPAQMGMQLCQEGVCVDYSARLREEASSVELLIAARDGREHFIQLHGPLALVGDFSRHTTYLVESRRRWVRIPLSAFLASVDKPADEPLEEP